MMRVIVWCKTYPELSARYRETVCTAGCLEDGSPVRLYPVPFRFLSDAGQYKLYDWIDVDLVRNPKDNRPESYRLRSDKIQVVAHQGTEGNWHGRREILERDRSWHFSCVANLAEEQARTGRSLGLVRVRRVERVWLKERPEDEARRHDAKLKHLKSEPGLFDSESIPRWTLDFLPRRVHVRWLCEGRQCTGHTAGVLDWGLNELARRDGFEVARQRMEDLCDLGHHDLAFFMGNFRAHPHRFGIIGMWYPQREPPTLFDDPETTGSRT